MRPSSQASAPGCSPKTNSCPRATLFRRPPCQRHAAPWYERPAVSIQGLGGPDGRGRVGRGEPQLGGCGQGAPSRPGPERVEGRAAQRIEMGVVEIRPEGAGLVGGHGTFGAHPPEDAVVGPSVRTVGILPVLEEAEEQEHVPRPHALVVEVGLGRAGLPEEDDAVVEEGVVVGHRGARDAPPREAFHQRPQAQIRVGGTHRIVLGDGQADRAARDDGGGHAPRTGVEALAAQDDLHGRIPWHGGVRRVPAWCIPGPRRRTPCKHPQGPLGPWGDRGAGAVRRPRLRGLARRGGPARWPDPRPRGPASWPRSSCRSGAAP